MHTPPHLTHTSIDGHLVAMWEYCEKFIYITVADINVMAWALCTPLPLLLMSGKKKKLNNSKVNKGNYLPLALITFAGVKYAYMHIT